MSLTVLLELYTEGGSRSAYLPRVFLLAMSIEQKPTFTIDSASLSDQTEHQVEQWHKPYMVEVSAIGAWDTPCGRSRALINDIKELLLAIGTLTSSMWRVFLKRTRKSCFLFSIL